MGKSGEKKHFKEITALLINEILLWRRRKIREGKGVVYKSLRMKDIFTEKMMKYFQYKSKLPAVHLD